MISNQMRLVLFVFLVNLSKSFACLMLLFGMRGIACASNYYVSPQGNDQNPGTLSQPLAHIQTAITIAAKGDKVILKDGKYIGSKNQNLDCAGKTLTISSLHGARQTIIDCSGPMYIAHFGFLFHSYEGHGETPCQIEGLTIQNSTTGGLVNENAVLKVSGCVFQNDGNNGFSGSTISGGAISNGYYLDVGKATTTLNHCSFTGNSAINGGTAIDNNFAGTIIVADCLFDEPSGTTINNAFANATLTHCILLGNAGSGVTNEYSKLAMSNCFLCGNGISNYYGITTLTNTIIYANTANPFGNGGVGFYNVGDSAILTDCYIGGNNGSGIVTLGTLFATNCTISGNSGYYGGGVDNYGGTATLIGCNILDNTAQYGGGVSNVGMIRLENCVVSRNFAQHFGGGFYDSYSSATITGCTFFQNTALDGGRGLENDYGDPILIDSVFWDDTNGTHSNEFNSSDESILLDATFCDIRGGYAGTGNINADPLFVSLTDLHLRPESPCIGTGTSAGAPLTDIDGVTRPNPPSIGAYEGIPAGPLHVLWTNTSGAASIWNYSASAGTFTQHTYGPYPGWMTKALADGQDGKTRVLWTTPGGQAALWSLDNTSGTFTQHLFGPYPGWAAKALSVGSGNMTHVLWTNTNGTASLWNYSTVTGSFTQHTFGPYPGWAATGIADGADGKTRVLWAKNNGTISLWSLDNTSGTFTQFSFGPYPGWSAKALSVGQDNTAHVLWTNTNGAASLWDYSAPTGSYTYKNYGPFGGWSAKAVADGADGKTSVLWTTSAGQASVWSLDSTTSVYTNHEFGPFTGWSAIGISAGP